MTVCNHNNNKYTFTFILKHRLVYIHMKSCWKVLIFVFYALNVNLQNLFSQEFLIDSLSCRITHIHDEDEALDMQADTVISPSPFLFSLKLPFRDDFSQNYIYPDGKKWIDQHAFVNSTYPVDPPTYGVATLDGLNKNGLPYNQFNPTAYGIADYLTSFPIDLSNVTDSVYLSFYYQPQGLGNNPESKDSLVLQFYHPVDSIWKSVWHAEGTTLHPFKRVMIYVDTTYYKDKFQFRFYNYATLSGNVDHWHIDYVYLNDKRTFDDTLMYDVAFVKPMQWLTKDYTSIPWKHYQTDPSGWTRPDIVVSIKNHSTTSQNIFYKLRIDDENGTQVGIYPSAPGVFNIINAQQSLDLTLPVGNAPFSFNYPANSNCHTFFVNRAYYYLGSGPDTVIPNDSIKHYQHFGNYYAWDDGTAEAAYGVQGVGAKAAVEFNNIIGDTLTGIDIYFNPVVNNVTQLSFKIKVWSSLSPENLLYEDTLVFYPQYTQPVNTFFRYKLSVPQWLPAGKFFIGWENITANVLNIGFDRNINRSDKLFFNIGNGWQNTSFQGSLMLRPVFGLCNDLFIHVNNDDPESNFTIYPNPAVDFVNIQSVNAIQFLYVYDVSGRMLYYSRTNGNDLLLNVSDWPQGIYIMKIIDDKFKSKVLKFAKGNE